MTEFPSSTTFLPKKSKGGAWLVGFLVGSLVIFVIPLIFLGRINIPWIFVMIGFLIVLLCGAFGVTVHGYYTMRYYVTEDAIVLKWSIIKRIIPLNMIRSVSTTSSSTLEGIRTFGVGIPGHLVGKFRLKLDGTYLPTTLFATNLENLVIIRTLDEKTYGITPDVIENFLKILKIAKSTLIPSKVDTRLPIRSSEKTSKRSRAWIIALFSLCIVLAIGTFIYTLLVYQNLPDIVPLHWGVNGLPNRWGDKSELLIMVSIFSGLEILISALIYIWMRKSDFGKVRLGILIMLFPLIITLVFSSLTVIILQLTITFA